MDPRHAARVYTAYRLRAIGKKADEAAPLALGAIADLTNVHTEIKAGRLKTAQEQMEVRRRAEAMAAPIEALEKCVMAVEERTAEVESRIDDVVCVGSRPGYPRYHAWDREKRRCTNRQ